MSTKKIKLPQDSKSKVYQILGFVFVLLAIINFLQSGFVLTRAEYLLNSFYAVVGFFILWQTWKNVSFVESDGIRIKIRLESKTQVLDWKDVIRIDFDETSVSIVTNKRKIKIDQSRFSVQQKDSLKMILSKPM